MNPSESYDELADHYHLIFEDWDAAVERQAAVLGAILESRCGLPRTARILDCACGIGTQALGLAARGFRVSGCDLSSRAVERARGEAARRGLEIPLAVADMRELEGLGDARFEAVICMDNALPHLETTAQIVRAAEQMRMRLRPGGFLMASIRDYDQLLETRPVVQAPAFHSDQGRRRIVFQVWDWVDDRRYVFHLYVTRETESGWQTIHASAPYRCVRRDEVTAALSEAGFRKVQWLFPEESGFYQPIVLAEAGRA